MRDVLAWGLLAASLVACSGDTFGSKPSGAAGDSSAGSHSGAGGKSAAGSTNGGSLTSGGVPPVSDATPLEDYPKLYTAALCQLLERCWQGFTLELGESCAGFLERELLEDQFPSLVLAVNEGRVAYHPEALQSCLEEVVASDCNAALIDQCEGVFSGTKPSGQACTIDTECVDAGECLVAGSCPGTCGARAKLEQACSAQNRCAAGLTCLVDAASDSGVCVESTLEGETCSERMPCSGFLYCAGLDRSVPADTGTCQTFESLYAGDEGAACSVGSEEPLCQRGLSCELNDANEPTGVCRALLESGAACTLSLPDRCPAGEYCKLSSGPGEQPAIGQCMPNPELGDECYYSTFGVAPCPLGQFCNMETKLCALSKHLGESCGLDEECYSDTCGSDGKCRALLECERP